MTVQDNVNSVEITQYFIMVSIIDMKPVICGKHSNNKILIVALHDYMSHVYLVYFCRMPKDNP